MITKEIVAKILYDVDPANTFCKENEMYSEYETEAEMITEEILNLEKDNIVLDVVVRTFDEQFQNVDIDFDKMLEISAMLEGELYI